jgi:hypothetical protein
VLRKPLPFKLYAQILIFSGLVALGALILWPLQQSLYGGMVSIRDNMIRRLERQIGRKIRYSSISPALFGSFDVRNISIMGRDDIPLLTMSRFRVAYSLLDILRGRTLAIRSVQIDSPLVNYNTDTDKDLLELFRTAVSGQGGSSKELAYILPEEIMIRIRNGKFQVLSGNDSFALDALDINAEIFDKSVALDGKWNISVSLAKFFGEPVDFQIAMTANGLCRMDMEDGAAIIAVPSVTGDITSAEPVALNVSMREGSLTINKQPDVFPFDASFEYGKDDKSFEGRMSCDNFRLSQIVSFSGGLEGLQQLLEVESSGAALIKRGNDGVFGYSVKLAGSASSNLAFRTDSASYVINIDGDENMARIEKLRFSMPSAVTHDAARPMDASFYGDAGFTGSLAFRPFAPEGILSFGNFSVNGRESVNADIKVYTEDSRINVFCDEINIGQGAVVIAANASLEPSENGAIFSVYAARTADKKRSFSLAGSLAPGFKKVDAKLSLDSFLAGDLIGLAAPFVKGVPMPDVFIELFGNTAVSTELSFNTDFVHVSYNTPGLVFSGRSGDRGFSGFASINGTDSRFELVKAQINRGEETLLLSARADFAELNNIGFSINAGYQDLSWLIQGTVLNRKTVNIMGSYGLKVNFSSSRDRNYSGVIHTEGFPVPFLGKPALLFLQANLRYNSSQAWSMEFERLELTDIISPAGQAQFRASGRADQSGVNFPNLYYRDGFGPLSGNINLLWSQSRSNAFSEITGTVSLLDNNKENYNINVSFQNNSLKLGLSGSSIRLGRFSEKANTLQADGEMRLAWDAAGFFNADLNLSSLRGKIHERDINVSAQAVMDSDELTVRRLAVNLNTLNGEVPQVVINNKTGTVKSNGNLRLFIGGKRAYGLLAVNADFKPVKSWLEIGKALDFFDGNAHVENFRYGDGAEPQSFDIAFTRGSAMNGSDPEGGSSLIVSGGPRNMIRLQVDDNGNFYAGLSSPSPVRGTAIGNISGNTINASCNDLFIDMAGVFTYLLPHSKDIYLTGGYVYASVDIKGPISDPEFFGSARGTSLRFVIPSFIPVELRPIPCSVVIEGNEINFGPVSTSVGKGAGSVSGKFLIDRWVPSIFDIDVTVPRDTPIPYSVGINGLTARGDTFGKLKLAMENMTLDVSGDLNVNNTVLGIDSDEFARSQTRPSDMENRSIVDLNISTGPIVEFFYPDQTFPILRANPDVGTKLHVTADTFTKQFSLTSDIKIRGGEIFYFERSFYIRSGLLVLRENELRFSPRLTARAETRDRNEDGPITISLIVDNAPLFDFTARFESSPPLSQMEILALMGQSLPGSQIDGGAATPQKDMMAFLNSGADMLAQFTFGRFIERRMRNFLQLDMFSFRTQFFQNAIFSVVPGLTQQPVDRQSQLGNYLDNTTLFGGKYISPDMFVQGMVTMRYDANRDNSGGILGGMTFQQNYGFELQGPVVFNNYNFRIRWDFLPEHPENWYANDNSITFTLTKSF